MRTSRIVEAGAAYYHIMSRVVVNIRMIPEGDSILRHPVLFGLV